MFIECAINNHEEILQFFSKCKNKDVNESVLYNKFRPTRIEETTFCPEGQPERTYITLVYSNQYDEVQVMFYQVSRNKYEKVEVKSRSSAYKSEFSRKFVNKEHRKYIYNAYKDALQSNMKITQVIK